MRAQLLTKVLIALAFLSVSIYGAQAQDVLFETEFTPAEGWVTEGTNASNPLTSGSQTIIYNQNSFTFSFTRCAITPNALASSTCTAGYVDIGKNDKANTSIAVSTSGTAGFFRLPVFDNPEGIQISFVRGSSTGVDRQMAIEYSLDGGASWMTDEDCIAPVLSAPSTTCSEFVCPKKFEPGTNIRITTHSSGGSLRLVSLTIKKYNPDNTPPVFVSMNPEDGATEISPSTRNITMTFSEPVKAGNEGSIYISDQSGTSMALLTSGQLSYNQENVTIPFPSDFFLLVNTEYYVIFESGAIKDMANNPTSEITKSFTTKVSASNEKEILSFKIKNQIGIEVINSAASTITLVANHDVDLQNDLAPAIIASEYAFVETGYKDFTSGSATYKITAENGSIRIWTVTITQQALKQATLPVIYKGSDENSWQYIVADGWTKNIAPTSVDNVLKMNNVQFTAANVNNTAYWVQNYFEPGANRISFRIRYGNNTSNFKIRLAESADGDLWDEVTVYAPSAGVTTIDGIPTAVSPDPTPMISTSSATMSLRSYTLKPTSQYVKWFYDLRTTTSYYLDDVVIENAPADHTAPTMTATVPFDYKAYSLDTKAQVFLQLSEAVKASESLIKHETSIKLNGKDLYEDHLICLRNGQIVLSNLDIPGAFPELLDSAATQTIVIPNNALVDLSNNAFAGKTITFTLNEMFPVDPNAIEGVAKDLIKVYAKDGMLFVSEEVAKIEIIDVTGRTVMSAKQTNQISVPQLKGVYIIKCSLRDGSVKVVKTIL